MHLWITYGAGKVKPSTYKLTEYINSNYVGDLEDRKYMMKYCFFINEVVVSWYSKKQWTVFTSITKAKYIALEHTAQESIWIRKFLNEPKMLDSVNTYTVNGDNETSIILTKNVESQSRTRHINLQHYYVRELVTDGKLMVK